MDELAFKVAFAGEGLHAATCWTGQGGGEEPYVLFLHGGGPATSSDSTRYLRADLAERGVASVAIDFLGHGRSGGRIEDASLRQRCEEALRVVDSLQPPQPRAIVATSMAGHTACRLLDLLRTDAVVLFCPAAYEARAEAARFGEAFRAVIRSTRSFDDSPAFEALRRYEGRVLCFYGSQEDVIPADVQQGYAAAAARARKGDFVRLDGAGHRLHDWISERPVIRRQVLDRVMDALS